MAIFSKKHHDRRVNFAGAEDAAQRFRPGNRLLAVLVGMLLALPVFAQPAGTNRPLYVFNVGMARVCFLNVNRNDAIAAYRVFLENSGRRFGNIYKANPEVYDDTPAYEMAIQHQPINLAVMDPWQFLTMDIHQQMKPFFTSMENGKVGRRYVVLTRRESGLNTLSSLRGKNILQLEMASENVGKIWLDTQLLAGKLGTQQSFFESVEVVAKPSAAVLPVFFGKYSACMVDDESFELMKELNPQVGRSLQIVAVSDIFADVVICLREGGWASEKFKSDTIQTLNQLHLDPAGQQICTLFKIDRLVPFEDSQLETIRKLRATYESLQKAKSP